MSILHGLAMSTLLLKRHIAKYHKASFLLAFVMNSKIFQSSCRTRQG